MKKDQVSKKDIISWFTKMKSVDLSVAVNKRHFVDKYINCIILTDDKITIYFNLRNNAIKPDISGRIISDTFRIGEPRKSRRHHVYGAFHIHRYSLFNSSGIGLKTNL